VIGPDKMKVFTCINDVCLEVDLRVHPEREGWFIAELGGREVRLELLERKPGSVTLAIDDQVGFYEFHHDKGKLAEVVHDNQTYRSELKNPQQEQLERLLEQFGAGMGGGGGDTKMSSPMPGKILGVSIKPGDKIELGQIVFVLEAMKMENELDSKIEGKIRSVNVKVGDSVQAGDVLFEVEQSG
jgi:biotin carboxyl carrier protein